VCTTFVWIVSSVQLNLSLASHIVDVRGGEKRSFLVCISLGFPFLPISVQRGVVELRSAYAHHPIQFTFVVQNHVIPTTLSG
jgi:hypothetical protein